MSKQQRIVTAAVKVILPCSGKEIILTGVRHWDAIMANQAETHKEAKSISRRVGEVQGFLDNFGTFLTKEDAWHVAVNAKQIIYKLEWLNGKLYSEMLY